MGNILFGLNGWAVSFDCGLIMGHCGGGVKNGPMPTTTEWAAWIIAAV
jgi:hypothetical protein